MWKRIWLGVGLRRKQTKLEERVWRVCVGNSACGEDLRRQNQEPLKITAQSNHTKIGFREISLIRCARCPVRREPARKDVRWSSLDQNWWCLTSGHPRDFLKSERSHRPVHKNRHIYARCIQFQGLHKAPKTSLFFGEKFYSKGRVVLREGKIK